MPILYHSDKLVTRWQDPVTRKITYRGKRVSADCPLTADERRVYVQAGTVAAVRAVMDARQCSLADAWALIKRARGFEQLKSGVRNYASR